MIEVRKVIKNENGDERLIMVCSRCGQSTVKPEGKDSEDAHDAYQEWYDKHSNE